MQKIYLITFLVVSPLAFSQALPNVFNFEIPQPVQEGHVKKTRFSDLVNTLLSGFHFSQTDQSKHSLINLMKLNPGKLTQTVNGFTWKDCGGTAGKITKLDISPDPIVFPGTLTVSAGLDLNSTLNAPLQMHVSIERSDDTGHWVPIPCIENFGTCNYTNVCELLATIPACPDPLVAAGIPCQCPFKQGTYNLNDANFEVDIDYIPTGNYRARADGHYGGKQVFCVDITLQISL